MYKRFVRIKKQQKFLPISSGADHCLILSQGRVWGLGDSKNKKFGDVEVSKKDTNFDTPQFLKQPNKMIQKIKQVMCGATFSMLLSDNDEVFTMGKTKAYCLGRKDDSGCGKVVSKEMKNIAEIYAGQETAYARTKDGKLFTWGSGGYGQMGQSGVSRITYRSSVPVVVPKKLLDNGRVEIVVVGGFHLFVFTNDGKLFSFGRNNNSQCCHDLKDSKIFEPSQVKLEFAKYLKDLACGINHTVFLTTTGDVYTVGYNFFGQISRNEQFYVLKRVNVDNQIVKRICADKNNTLFFTKNGIWGCGKNENFHFAQKGNKKILKLRKKKRIMNI